MANCAYLRASPAAPADYDETLRFRHFSCGGTISSSGAVVHTFRRDVHQISARFRQRNRHPALVSPLNSVLARLELQTQKFIRVFGASDGHCQEWRDFSTLF